MIERFERACVLWCCVTISTWSKELQSNFVSNWVKVLPKLTNCYKKRMEVIPCLVQRHLNGLNDFERVGSRWRMMMEKSRVKTMFIVFFDAQGVIRREFVPEDQTVNGSYI
jgi:methyl coenzyme M reductase subunit C